MSDCTPGTEAVRAQYTREQPPHIGTVAEKSAEFDRWLEQHSEAIRADEREKVASAIEAIHHEMSHWVLITKRRQALFDGMRYAAEIVWSGGDFDE